MGTGLARRVMIGGHFDACRPRHDASTFSLAVVANRSRTHGALDWASGQSTCSSKGHNSSTFCSCIFVRMFSVSAFGMLNVVSTGAAEEDDGCSRLSTADKLCFFLGRSLATAALVDVLSLAAFALAVALGLRLVPSNGDVAPAAFLLVTSLAADRVGRSSLGLPLSFPLPLPRDLPSWKESTAYVPHADKSIGCGVEQAAACARLALSISAFSVSHVANQALLRTKCCFQRSVRQHA